MIVRRQLAAAVVLVVVAVAGCSDDGDEAPEPSAPATDVEAPPLERIDGPASVDPSSDPLATIAPTTAG